jgi:diguanylate cyclase (GGDEF)-like protein
MKLQKKSFLVIGIIWVAFIALICGLSRYLILDSYLKSEQYYVQRDLDRIDETVKEINRSLYLFTNDWAHWNDLYNFMLGKNPDFVSKNLGMNVYKDSTINLMSFWDTKGNLVFGTGIDPVTGQYTKFPDSTEGLSLPRTLLLNYPNHPQEIHGYVLSEEGDTNRIMLVASSSITNGGDATSVGTIITGRYLTKGIIDKVNQIAQTDLQVYSIHEINQDPRLKTAFGLATSGDGHYNQPINDKSIEAFSVIHDIFGKPIGFFREVKPRTIYLAGLNSYRYFQIIVVLLGVIAAIVLSSLFRKIIINRFEKLDDFIADVRAHKKIHKRIQVSGKDEVTDVANEFNALLDTIEDLHSSFSKKSEAMQLTNAQLTDQIDQYKKGEVPVVTSTEHFVNLSHYDTLTSLPNRVFFNEIFNKAMSHSRVNNKTLSIIILDLDHFKTVNNTYGRQIGDTVLKEIATRIGALLRPGDLLARLEGDEFIVLLNDIAHPKFASSVAEKMLHSTMEVVKVEGHDLFLTASIGISVFPNAANSLEDMVKNAEIALYKAKHAGGGVFQYFTQEMSHEKYENIQLETALRKAITNNEFVLFYQPILNLKNGTISGVEALIRWMHPTLGMIDPVNFIPFAERTGLIIKIGEWVLRTACATNKRWQDEGYSPIPIAVNLSPNQFKLQDISQLVTSILSETGLDPACLEIEITESAFLDDDKETVSRINDIHQMGVNIAIDDFGTGKFSLAYIKKLQINMIKIDKSLIKGIPTDQNDEMLANAIIAMAHNLNVKVVAEGVETAEQIQYLFEHQCDMIQGYYISPPLPENRIVFLFTKKKDEVSV